MCVHVTCTVLRIRIILHARQSVFPQQNTGSLTHAPTTEDIEMKR